MKKIICLILCVLLSVGVLAGCNLFEHNYEKDNAQVIVTINPIADQKVTGQRVKRDPATGLPMYDVDGKVVMEDVNTTYTSQKIVIYKSQLVNYANYYLYDQLNSGSSVEDSMEYLLEMLINSELLMIEADKLFDAGILYWTQDEVDEIQRQVYTSISDGVFAQKNTILETRDETPLPEKGGDPSTGETTYPLPPEQDTEQADSPEYPMTKTDKHQWFDEWYTQDTWYIQGDAYKTTYPGLYGDLKEKSLASEAFANYLDEMIKNSENIIGVTAEQKQEIKQNIQDINKVKDELGVEYVYPMIGRTTMFKLMIGNSYLKTKKLEKLQNHITESTEITELDIQDYYNKLLKKQKRDFAIRTNYDTAVDGAQTILYTPTNRYLYVKHILLPFSDEQLAELETIKKQEGITGSVNIDVSKRKENEIRYMQRRAALARKTPVYPHVNGENDLSAKTTVKKVTDEITAIMTQFERSPYDADRAFTDLIYKYNTDPGIFGSEKGYAVVYKTEDGEQEKYMPEFALAARAFRDETRPFTNDKYAVGQLFYDKDTLDENGMPVPYTVTDYGIHIMYYSHDPVAGSTIGMGPRDYLTTAKYTKVYDIMKSETLQKAQTDVYSLWEDGYLTGAKSKHASVNQKVIDKYTKELTKIVQG